MPLVSTRGAASAQGFGEFAQSAPANYIEDVFQTWLYTGNGGSQTITNGIDLAGKGGLVWIKGRSAESFHRLSYANNTFLNSATFDGATSISNTISSSSSGFSLGSNSAAYNMNDSGQTFASWSFREQPKFFDVVTWTGNGANDRKVAHSLGSVPGCIMVKRTDTTGNWQVYHRGVADPEIKLLVLSTTAAAVSDGNVWWGTPPTSTEFTVGGVSNVNASGGTYVALVFAHNAGGFGLTGTDNVISCGSFVVESGTGNFSVNLGYEPQWILFKRTDSTSNWSIVDNMRGIPVTTTGNKPELRPNTSTAETENQSMVPTATGFQQSGGGGFVGNSTYIYIAIRRGPMKVPTTGTSVFEPISTIASGGTVRTTGFPVDLQILLQKDRANYLNTWAVDRLRGVSTTNTASGRYVFTNTTDPEATANAVTRNFGNTGYVDPNFFGSMSMLWWSFRRAPSFMDVVCYTGTGSTNSINHNLGVVPELMIIKGRSATTDWTAMASFGASTFSLGYLNATLAFASLSYAASADLTTRPTATTFSLGTGGPNGSGTTYVAYLFASCPGVSKVGTYTGTGATQTINCGFTGGARFVMIKRTNGTGNWWVWDTARGMAPGLDFRIPLNTTDADSNSNEVYTASGGFQIVTVDSTINASGGNYIYLAIA